MHFLSSFQQWLEDLTFYFPYFPVIIQIAIVVSVLAIAGTVGAYTAMLIYRWQQQRHLKKEMPLRAVGDTLLLDHVIAPAVNTPEGEQPLALQAFEQLGLGRRWARATFTSQLIEYRQNFTGDIPQRLRELYLELGLQHDAVSHLHSGRRKKVIAALVELSGMGVLVEKDFILQLTDSKDKYIREMARCYIVQCSPDHPFEFLDHVKEPILLWEQFELFRIISLRKDIPAPAFERWIAAEYHPTVITLALKLATYYQQPESIRAMLRLMPVCVEPLRALIINCLGKLVAETAEPTLVAMYPQESLSVKMEILKALGRIGSGHYLDFLRHELEHADEFLLMKHAARSIVSHHALARDLIAQLQQSLTGTRLLVLQHSLNPLIKY
ncbi:HEAT repeat domain-containing protein [Chitinophaga vietnamensis]|uniref:HEAT repeat domain-containing protein n=1 Tax=Chitinophaga vietnamensis TaxID=2593957 RepID=UPI00117799EA|nr:HEAT repeat domain-containing protein [Chitinophaga vietnamensis]